jgi:hypothetical protein
MARNEPVIWVKWEVDYFCTPGWTGQISLKPLRKIAPSRTSIMSVSGAHSSALLRIPDSRQRSREIRKVPNPEVAALIRSPRPQPRAGSLQLSRASGELLVAAPLIVTVDWSHTNNELDECRGGSQISCHRRHRRCSNNKEMSQ